MDRNSQAAPSRCTAEHFRRRIACIMAVLIGLLCISYQPVSLAEGETEDIPPSLGITVTYSDPEDNGRIDGWFTVTCDKGNRENAPATAKNVVVTVKAHEFVNFLDISGPYEIAPKPDNTYQLDLHDVTPGDTVQCYFRLKIEDPAATAQEEKTAFAGLPGIKASKEKPHIHLDEEGNIIVPWIRIEVESDNYGSCLYTCDLDIAPVARVFLMGWEDSAGAIRNDVDMMEEVYSSCYYNGLEIEDVRDLYGVDWNDIKDQIEAMDADKNDVTYFYVNAHGAADLRTHIFGTNAGYRTEYQGQMTDASNLIAYTDMLETFGGVEGRVVILFDSCFSGRAVNAAPQYLDSDRMVILSAVNGEMYSGTFSDYGWFTNDLVKIAGASGYPSWETVSNAFTLAGETSIRIPVAETIVNEQRVIASLLTNDYAVMAQEVYAQESAREIRIYMNEVEAGILYFFRSFVDKEGTVESILTGINPQIYGDSELPVFVTTPDYDDEKVIVVVKNEETKVYPPGWEVVFSYDAETDFSGIMTMYLLSEGGHLFPETDPEDPASWQYRVRLTDDNFAYRPAPLEKTGGISTRIYAEKLGPDLVLAEWDTGVGAAGPNAPWNRNTYTIYRLSAEGIVPELTGTTSGQFDPAAYEGTLEPEITTYTLNGEKCTEAEFLEAFGEYGIHFETSTISVSSYLSEICQVAYGEEGEVILSELRSDVESELPPALATLQETLGIEE